MNKPELLSPAGDIERLQFAVRYGADAVYLGADRFGMRAAPKNFTMEQLHEGVQFAHAAGKRVYLTLNSVPTNEEIATLPDFIRQVRETGIDAFIVADLGVLSIVKKFAPEIDVHFSTQVGIVNFVAANAAYDMGAKRVVLARELSLQDIAVIRENTPRELELEAFVHGAMCMSFSGRCLLSHYLTGRDANRGECTQPCRWEWQMTEPYRPNAPLTIGEEEGGSYILNANDLCTAPFIDLVAKAGIDSLKIEGRAKSFYYVASVTAAYRSALDAYLAQGEQFSCPEFALDELTRTSHRKYSPGFFFGKEDAVQNTKQGGYLREWEVVGVVQDYMDGFITCEQRGKFVLGDMLEALTPDGKCFSFTPDLILDEMGESIPSVPHAKMIYRVPCPHVLAPYSILRKKL